MPKKSQLLLQLHAQHQFASLFCHILSDSAAKMFMPVQMLVRALIQARLLLLG
jgi:hypothetical protein